MQSGSGSGRGRHRSRRSRETREFEQLARRPGSVLNLPAEPTNQHGIRILGGSAPDKDAEAERTSAPPERPAWLADDETWRLLLEMRKGLGD